MKEPLKNKDLKNPNTKFFNDCGSLFHAEEGETEVRPQFTLRFTSLLTPHTLALLIKERDGDRLNSWALHASELDKPLAHILLLKGLETHHENFPGFTNLYYRGD